MSLLLVSHLGTPGSAHTEPLPFSLPTSDLAPAERPENLEPLEPEGGASGLMEDVFAAPSLVEQAEGEDSSGTLAAQDPGAGTPKLAEAETPKLPDAATPKLPDTSAALVPPAATYEVEDNHYVRRLLDQFQTGDRRAVVETWLVRSGRYLPMILDVFRQKGLPEDLVFTAMIESGFNPVAVSRAGAKGLWQFMAPTARAYGLRVDRWLDERLDPEKSTIAAARHLLDLYSVFGSWTLVQAAYNAGEMKVLRAIRGMGTTDFWALTRGRLLKEETKNFVPAIQAASLIAREPERYGFLVTPEDPLQYDVIQVPQGMSLKRIASISGVDLSDLDRLNPELKLKQTPPGGAYALKVPVGSAAQIQTALEQEAAARQRVLAPRPPERGKGRSQAVQGRASGVHVVKPRETIAGIAKRYGVSVEEIARWNDLGETGRIFPGDRLRVVSRPAREEAQEQGGFR